jgi:hypothetical protein
MHVAAGVATAVLAGTLLTGCGSGRSAAGDAVPEGWKTMDTKRVTVAHPASFKEQSDAKRSKHNAAAATLVEGGKTVGIITVQVDFTNADSAEEAAIGAEAGVQLGSTMKNTKDVTVSGTDEAKRVDFEYGSTGEGNTPAKGTRVDGVIVTGLDSKGVTFTVRIDAQRGKLSATDLNKIIKSIRVR